MSKLVDGNEVRSLIKRFLNEVKKGKTMSFKMESGYGWSNFFVKFLDNQFHINWISCDGRHWSDGGPIEEDKLINLMENNYIEEIEFYKED